MAAKESPRPVIGINTDYFLAGKTYSAHARVNAGYFDAVYAAGGLPILLPPLGKEAEIDSLLDRCDGVLLTGGLDMDPRKTNQPLTATVQPMAERRDSNDRILVRRVIDRQMPVLAIGVGMQQINVLMGGSLFSHLPVDCPKALPHFDPTGAPHRHIVMLEENTRIEEIYGTNELRVNSRHHQGINVVAKGLRVGGRAPDGVIEALESEDSDWFCLAVQWHPEADTASALDMQMFECFVQATARESQAGAAPRFKLAAA
ncbi:gamma-glutamyl-gamma-aminobutyrate hydrolase family protein [Zavarzinella formosa]|uniref:gamma-glutamyl-gamma-aminobutyrate hydrolase family protein n=1 Tax=Zavarzinella formosa TaxID=360055 RepID=UPI0002EED70A|nr:gamma-glutamyl-gamma-aminobutyrate hydrolase family protein [Zavarzinella formosa]